MTRKISTKLGVALVLLIVALVGFIGQSFEENFETSGLVIDAYTQKTRLMEKE